MIFLSQILQEIIFIQFSKFQIKHHFIFLSSSPDSIHQMYRIQSSLSVHKNAFYSEKTDKHFSKSIISLVDILALKLRHNELLNPCKKEIFSKRMIAKRNWRDETWTYFTLWHFCILIGIRQVLFTHTPVLFIFQDHFYMSTFKWTPKYCPPNVFEYANYFKSFGFFQTNASFVTLVDMRRKFLSLITEPSFFITIIGCS